MFHLKFNELTLTDEDTQSKIDERYLRMQVVVPNEIRAKKGWPALDGGDEPSPWRVVSAIVYLNDDYDGGNTYFPQYDLSITPKAGNLLTFPCTLEYMHGVSEVKNHTRFTIATFWTYDKNKEI
jgi:hypothetical protein